MNNLPIIKDVISFVNGSFEEIPPFVIIVFTCAVLWFWNVVWRVLENICSNDRGVIAGIMEYLYDFVHYVPVAGNKLNEEEEKAKQQGIKSYTGKAVDDEEFKFTALPEEGKDGDVLVKRMQSYITNYSHKCWKKGKCTGTVYIGSDKHVEVVNRAYNIFSITNPLHYDIFPSLYKFEKEIIRMTATMMRGGPEVRGLLTSGGTESIMLALYAYREEARKKKPWIKRPEVVMPITAHVAHDKGCYYFGIKLIRVKVNPVTQTVEPREIEKRITKNTIAIVGSAPQYPHGVVDPIKDLGKLAIRYGIRLHVDSCLGGFIMPFIRRLPGANIPDFDFSVPGVSSISADTHKFGLAPKGTSVVLFKNRELRNRTFFYAHDWPGGHYATPTFAGSRSGGLVAACWASMVHQGDSGYMKTAAAIWEVANDIRAGLTDIPELEVGGSTASRGMVVNIQPSSKGNINIYQIMDLMKDRGWKVQGTQFPPGFHFCVSQRSGISGNGKDFISNLKNCVEEVKKNPKVHSKKSAMLYGIGVVAPRAVIGGVAVACLQYFLDGEEDELVKVVKKDEKKKK